MKAAFFSSQRVTILWYSANQPVVPEITGTRDLEFKEDDWMVLALKSSFILSSDPYIQF